MARLQRACEFSMIYNFLKEMQVELAWFVAC